MIDLGGPVRSARLADVDGDGNLDLVYLVADRVRIQHGDGHGHFDAAVDGPVVSAWYLAAGDLDGDGTLELVTAGGSSVIAWQQAATGWTQLASNDLYDDVTGLEVADVDGYVGDDVAVTTSGEYEVLRPSNGWLEAIGSANLSAIDSLAVGDANDDGRADGLVASNGFGVVADGSASGVGHVDYFAGDAEVGTSPHVSAVAAGDVDGDGEANLAMVQVEPNALVVEQPGQANEVAELTSPARMVALAELDGAKGREIVIGLPDSDRIQVFRTSPGHVPAMAATLGVPEAITALHADGDVDGDGTTDLAVTLTDEIAVVRSGRY